MLGPDLLILLKAEIVTQVKLEYPTASEAKVKAIFDAALRKLLKDRSDADIERRISQIVE